MNAEELIWAGKFEAAEESIMKGHYSLQELTEDAFQMFKNYAESPASLAKVESVIN